MSVIFSLNDQNEIITIQTNQTYPDIFIQIQQPAAINSKATHRTIARETTIWSKISGKEKIQLALDNFKKIDKEAYFAIKAQQLETLRQASDANKILQIRKHIASGLDCSIFQTTEIQGQYADTLKFLRTEYILNEIDTNIANEQSDIFYGLSEGNKKLILEFYVNIANNVSAYLEQENDFNQTIKNEGKATIDSYFKNLFEGKIIERSKFKQISEWFANIFSSDSLLDPFKLKDNIKEKFPAVKEENDKTLIADRLELTIRKQTVLPFYNAAAAEKTAAQKKAFRQAELTVQQALFTLKTKKYVVSDETKTRLTAMIGDLDPEALYKKILDLDTLTEDNEAEKLFKMFIKIFYAHLIVADTNYSDESKTSATDFINKSSDTIKEITKPATGIIADITEAVTEWPETNKFFSQWPETKKMYNKGIFNFNKMRYSIKDSAYYLGVEKNKSVIDEVAQGSTLHAQKELAKAAGIDHAAFAYIVKQVSTKFDDTKRKSDPEGYADLLDTKIAEYKKGREGLINFVVTPAITDYKAQSGKKTWGGLCAAVQTALTNLGVDGSNATTWTTAYIKNFYAINKQNSEDGHSYSGTKSTPSILENNDRKSELDSAIEKGNIRIQAVYKNIYDTPINAENNNVASNYSLSSAQLRLDEVRKTETKAQRKKRFSRTLLQNARLLKEGINTTADAELTTTDPQLQKETLRDDSKNLGVLNAVAKNRTWWSNFFGKPAARGFAGFTSINTAIVVIGLFTPLAPAAALYFMIMVSVLSFTYMLGAQGIIDFNEWTAKDDKNVFLNEFKRKYAEKILYGIVGLTLIALFIGAAVVFSATTSPFLLGAATLCGLGTIAYGAYHYFKQGKQGLSFTPTERTRHKLILFIGLALLTCGVGLVLGMAWPIWVGAIAAFSTGYIINYYLQRFSIADALIKKLATQDKHGIIRLYWGYKLGNKMGPGSLRFLKVSFMTNIVLALLYGAIGYRQIMRLTGDEANIPITLAPVIGPLFEAILPFVAGFSFFFIFVGYLLLSTGPMASAIQWVANSIEFIADKEARSRFSLKEFLATWLWHKPGNFLKNPNMSAGAKIVRVIVNVVAFVIFPILAILGMAALLINSSGKTISNIIRDIFGWDKPINDETHPDYDPNAVESNDSKNAYYMGLAIAITGITIKTPLVAKSCISTIEPWINGTNTITPEMKQSFETLKAKATQANAVIESVNKLVGERPEDSNQNAFIKRYLELAQAPENNDQFTQMGFLIVRLCNAILNAELASDFVINNIDGEDASLAQLLIFSGAFSQSFVLAEIGRQGYTKEVIQLIADKINKVIDAQYHKAFNVVAAKKDNETTSSSSSTARPTTISLNEAFKRKEKEDGSVSYHWNTETLVPKMNRA